ncbi:MAG: AAA family ATPase [Candidatus Bathyarchaeia archaeon]
MKIAIAGKGGVGKTLISGTLARIYARQGYRVLAVDADPSMNLAYSIGIPPEISSKIVPIAENASLIEERTGAKPGLAFGIFFSLTPTVEDIADRYGVIGPDGVRLLVMGTIRSGGSGCACPANSLISALIRHIAFRERDIVIMDLEAGLEPLGRATARGFDALLCIVEPSAPSIETAMRIKDLASEIGINRVFFVGNKVSDLEEKTYIEGAFSKFGLSVLCVIPFDADIVKAGRLRVAPIDYSPSSPAVLAIKELSEKLMRSLLEK